MFRFDAVQRPRQLAKSAALTHPPGMTSRERFCRTLGYRASDRAPLFEEGLRDDVLDRWLKEGLAGKDELASRFRYDGRIPLDPDLAPSGLLRGRENLAAYRRELNPDDPARLPAQLAGDDFFLGDCDVRGLTVTHGFFQALGVRDGASFCELMYLLEDDPGCVQEALHIHARFAASLLERILRKTQVEYALFSEPIGSTHGPLLSPCLYRDLVLSSYRPLFETLRRHRVETVVFATYANARSLLNDVLEAGCNTLWSMESESCEMDYLELRRCYGTDLRLIGGIDLDALTRGREAIRSEVLGKVPELCEQGGVAPLADGRVRVTVALADYVYYRELLEETVRAR